MKIMKINILLLLGLVSAIGSFSCFDRPTSSENPNILPTTTIANIPVEGDTIFALVTLSWDGGDDDGYISGYEYRYITDYFDSIGLDTFSQTETTIQPWSFTTESSKTIAFDSNEDLNRQTFQVRSIDNDGEVDETPAEKQFYTSQTFVPVTTIISPLDNEELFVLPQTTDWWKGILLIFTGFDKDGEILEYGLSVDDTSSETIDWLWMTDTSFYITPDMFKQPLEGEHLIRVTARDNTNLIDPEGSRITVSLVAPKFNKDVLIIDETFENFFPTGFDFSDAQVDSFYQNIFINSDVSRSISTWDYQQNGLPPLDTLAQYKLIFWHADGSEAKHNFPEDTEVLIDYLNIGGDLILSGWRIFKSFRWSTVADEKYYYNLYDEIFATDYLHIEAFAETRKRKPYFTGARSTNIHFSDVEMDSARVAGTENDTYNNGQLDRINVVTERGPFTEVLYTYQSSKTNDEWEDLPCIIRYYGTSFNTIVVGFPIFFLVEEDAQIMVNEMLESLGL